MAEGKHFAEPASSQPQETKIQGFNKAGTLEAEKTGVPLAVKVVIPVLIALAAGGFATWTFLPDSVKDVITNMVTPNQTQDAQESSDASADDDSAKQASQTNDQNAAGTTAQSETNAATSDTANATGEDVTSTEQQQIEVKPPVDKSALYALIVEAWEVDGSAYTSGSYKSLRDLIELTDESSANQPARVYSNEDATQEQVNAAARTLRSAIDNLVPAQAVSYTQDQSYTAQQTYYEPTYDDYYYPDTTAEEETQPADESQTATQPDDTSAETNTDNNIQEPGENNTDTNNEQNSSDENNQPSDENGQPDDQNQQPSDENNQPDDQNQQPSDDQQSSEENNQPDDQNQQPSEENNQPDDQGQQPSEENNQPEDQNQQ